MKKAGRIFIKLLGVVLIMSVFGAIYYMMEYQVEPFVYEEVVVANRDIEPGETLNEEMFEYIQVSPISVWVEGINDPSTINGLVATQFIPKKSQFHTEFFDQDIQLLGYSDKGEKILLYSVPKEWIYSFPSSMRKGDTINFYPINILGPTEEKGTVASAEVAYVKDSSNREVVDTNSDNRYNGSSTIDHIEILATQTLIKELQTQYEKGYEFMITWSE